MATLRIGLGGPLMFACLALAAVPLAARAAPEFNPAAQRAEAGAETNRLIVRLRGAPAEPLALAPAAVAAGAARVAALASRVGVGMHHSHALTDRMHVMHLAASLSGEALEALLERVRADSDVEVAEPDGRKYAHATLPPPNDPLFPGIPGQGGQWYLMAPIATVCNAMPCGTTTAAIDAVSAWDVTTGSTGIVIAILDTGVRFEHPDLQPASAGGRLLPGRTFIGPDGGSGTSFLTANDGGGWDADASDPGDWIDANDVMKPVFSKCTQEPSSWHGTRVAGIIGALTNNGKGIAGIDWNARLLPVRVLGKCGGYDSDIIAAIRWASGYAVAGVPTNPNPARIINMSLGSVGACTQLYQSTIDAANAAGTIVVASAGNEGGPVDEPANCRGVIGVTAARHVGTKVGFANVSGSIDGVSASVALTAPGGNCVNTNGGPCLFSIDTTTNLGTTTPNAPGPNDYTNQLSPNLGTSFSAPIVAGIASLMLSVNGNLTPAQVLARLQEGATPFPTIAVDSAGKAIPQCHLAAGTTAKPDTSQSIECNCTTTSCGAGLANAPGAVRAALRPIAVISGSAAAAPGQTVTLSGSGSLAATGRVVGGYAWTISGNTSGGTPALSATSGAASALTAPACGTVTVQLTVTDDANHTDRTTVDVSQSPATSCAATPAASGGGGGGGALDSTTLLAAGLCAAALALARRRRRGALTR